MCGVFYRISDLLKAAKFIDFISGYFNGQKFLQMRINLQKGHFCAIKQRLNSTSTNCNASEKSSNKHLKNQSINHHKCSDM